MGDNVKIVYIISVLMFEVLLLSAAVLVPIYITIGWYYWSVFFIFIMFLTGTGFHDRLNRWE